MSVVMIVNAKINKNEKQAVSSYVEKAGILFKSVGAKPLNKYLILDKIVGEIQPDLISITEFSNVETLKCVFASEEYQRLLTLRNKAFIDLIVFIGREKLD